MNTDKNEKYVEDSATKKKNRSKVVFLGIIMGFLVLFISVFVAAVFLIYCYVTDISVIRKKREIEAGAVEYRIWQRNTLLNESNHGKVSIYGGIPSGRNFEYFRVDDRGQNHILVSEFGENTEYECSGSCICNDVSIERRNVNVLTGSLYVLVASVSSLGAMYLAKNRFQTECLENFEEYCPLDAIEASVDECLPPPAFVGLGDSTNTKVDDGYRKIRCQGTCKNLEFSGDKNFWASLTEDTNCEMKKIYDFEFLDKEFKFPVNKIHYNVKIYFIQRVLTPFCENAIRRETEEYYNEYKKQKMNDVPLCVRDFDSVICWPIVDGKPMEWAVFYKHFKQWNAK